MRAAARARETAAVRGEAAVAPAGSYGRARQKLLADYGGGVVEHREDSLESRHLQDLPDRRPRPGQLKLTAPFAGVTLGGEQDVHAGGVTELDPGHVHDNPDGIAASQRRCQLGVQPRGCVEVDLAYYRHNGVIALIPARDL